MKKLVLLVIILFTLNFIFAEVISHQEKSILYKSMEKNSLDSTDVNFFKDWSSDTQFKLAKVIQVLNKPFSFPDLVSELDESITSTNSLELLMYMGSIIDTLNQQNFSSPQISANSLEKVSFDDMKDLRAYIETVWNETDKYWKAVWENLSAEEIQKLRYFAISLHSEAEDSLFYKDFFDEREITEYDSLEIEDYIKIIKKIDFNMMKKATSIFNEGLENLIEAYNRERFYVNDKVEFMTQWGRFALGTNETDLYQGSYCFILDPGGDDIYQVEVNTDVNHPYYWVIDFAGDDTYRNQRIQNLFSSFFGLGSSVDFDGNDIYQGGDFTFSALFGSNLHTDFAGDDIYCGGLHSIASASFGLSLLEDFDGDDSYDVTQFGQGFASTLACGILADHGGDDNYNAGRKYYHAPLAPFDHRSMAQGFGFGIRPYMGGGIGVLYDSDGNDHYNGGVYSQAVAYWYALGIIIDKKGNDFYDAVYYPQGSGIHLAGGFLLDQEGEDHYYSKHGPGQGAGHDYGVGFLVDRAGDDSYSVEGGNGLALTNSVAVFLDVSGSDRYERFNSSNYGHSNVARDSGGIGLFLDTGGDDTYNSEKSFNDTTWVSGWFGIGKDTLLFEPENKLEEEAIKEAAEIDSLASIDEIFSIASEWGVGSGVKRVNQASEILLSRDSEAAEYIYLKKLGTKSGLTYRAIKNYSKKSEIFSDYLLKALTHEDSLWNKNAIALLGETGDSIYIDTLTTFLDKNKYVNTVLSTLGMIKSQKAVSILRSYSEDVSEKRRIIVARSLKKIDIPLSREYLYQMIDDESFLIKTMIKLSQKDNLSEKQ